MQLDQSVFGGLLIPHSWYNILYTNTCPS